MNPLMNRILTCLINFLNHCLHYSHSACHRQHHHRDSSPFYRTSNAYAPIFALTCMHFSVFSCQKHFPSIKFSSKNYRNYRLFPRNLSMSLPTWPFTIVPVYVRERRHNNHLTSFPNHPANKLHRLCLRVLLVFLWFMALVLLLQNYWHQHTKPESMIAIQQPRIVLNLVESIPLQFLSSTSLLRQY